MMTSAVPILAAATVVAAKPGISGVGENPGKSGAGSFAETLGKVDKATVSSKASNQKPASAQAPAKAPETTDSSSPEKATPTPATESTTPQQPPVKDAKEPAQDAIQAKPEVDPTTVVDQTKPSKDKDSIESQDPESVIQVAPGIQVEPVVAIPQVQTQVQASAEEPVSQQALGSSILASIKMGKSLDRMPQAVETEPSTVSSKVNAELLGTKDGASSLISGQPRTADGLNHAAKTESAPPVANTVEKALPTPTRTDLKPSEFSEKQVDLRPADSTLKVDGVASPTHTYASNTTSGASPTTAVPTLQTPVTNPDWAKNLGQQLVNFHLKGDQNVQLHLNPSNLGPMSITLNVNEHLQATAHFSSHSAQVRSALEQGLAQLRDSMSQQGITLGEASVGEQRQQGFTQSNSSQPQRFSQSQSVAGIAIEETTPAPATRIAGSGEISTYA